MKTLADLFSAVSDPTRVAMLELLRQRGELCVCEIQEILDVTQSRASRHLKTLREAGLVQDRRMGTWAHYRLTEQPSGAQAVLLEALTRLVPDEAAAEVGRKYDDWRARNPGDLCGAPVPKPLGGFGRGPSSPPRP